MFQQLEDVILKCDSLSRKLKNIEKEHSKEIKALKSQIKKLEKENSEKDQRIQELEQENANLKGEILRLKHNNNKDSSNSSKPSSTNGYKKVITNRREPSTKKKGGQLGHKGSNLNKSKLNKILKAPNTVVVKKEINKNKFNENKKPIIRRTVDIETRVVVTELWYYPDNDGKYNIPQEHSRFAQYGNNIKAMTTDLLYEVYNSTDGVCNFISSITNNLINLSKGTLINWANELSNKLASEIENIEANLMESYYNHCDESNIKVDSKSYNNICACNKKYTRLWIRQYKDHETLKEIEFFANYKGVIIKDGTDIYNGFGIILAQCLSHIQRYIKNIIDANKHTGATLMKTFLTKCYDRREELIASNEASFTKHEYDSLMNEYERIISDWKREWMNSTENSNPVYDDERKLLHRLESKDKEEILYFLKDFNVPATNNPAEVDQRNIKIKQKIGKFRSVTGAEVYATIRSCINTYKKNSINVFRALLSAFQGATVIV